ncbi:MAG: hypothetical protein IKH27_01525 [Oscillospiraceae bacterium]|nr:hypothetical protein [Oscillospiraceae bacterium]
MLGSDYRELIVPKNDNMLQRAAILIGGAVLTGACAVFALVTGRPLLLIPAAALGFGTWYLHFLNRIEYEYIISGDELSVTKILGESKRKPMLTVSVRKFTAFKPMRDAEPTGSGQTIVLACTAQDDTAFCADFDHDQYGQTRLIWTPNDDILLYLTKQLPRNLGFRWEAKQNSDPNE